MKIVQKRVGGAVADVVETVFNIVKGTEAKPAVVRLYKIDVGDTLGAVPAKSWHDGVNVRLVFYVSPSIPATHRPFAEGMYAFVLHDVGEYTEVTYPIGEDGPRVFIDQVFNSGRVSYVVVFDAAQYDKIVTKVVRKDDR